METRQTLATMLAAAMAFVVTGCGGNAGAAGGGNEGTTKIGDLSIAGVLKLPVLTAGDQDAVVSGLRGNITQVDLVRGNSSLEATTVLGTLYERDGTVANTFSIRADGTSLGKVTAGSAMYAVAPSISPDGRKIAYMHFPDVQWDVYIWDIATGTRQAIATNSPTKSEQFPKWSGDGTRLVFQRRNPNSGWDIVTYNVAAGTEADYVNSTGLDEVYPTFDPTNNDRIAFSRTVGSFFEIRTGSIATGAEQIVTAQGTGDSIQPDFSPDGKRLAFSTYTTSEQNYELLVYTFGSNQGYERWSFSPENDQEPFWSPDGTELGFLKGGRLWRTKRGGTDTRAITPQGTVAGTGDWFGGGNPRKLVGTTGAFGNSSGGLLFSRSDKSPKSYVSFDSSDRATIVITPQTGLGNGLPIISFVVEGAPLTALGYLDLEDPFATIVRVVGVGGLVTSATGAFVDFSSTTGQVTSILVFGSQRPEVVRKGETLEYRGHFLAAIDASGERLDVQSSVGFVKDLRTGRLRPQSR